MVVPLVAVCGCAREPDNPVTVVTGTVTVDGNPLAGAEVIFWPKDNLELGTNIPAVTGSDGKFEVFPNLQTGVILKPGSYRVLIGKYVPIKPDAAGQPADVGPDDDYDPYRGRNILPAVYNHKQRSPNLVEIKAGENDFQVELKSRP